MRAILRTGLIGCVVLGSVTVTDEARATPAAVPAGTVWQWTVGKQISLDAPDLRRRGDTV